jgi:hypothetical protein
MMLDRSIQRFQLLPEPSLEHFYLLAMLLRALFLPDRFQVALLFRLQAAPLNVLIEFC